MTPRHLTHPLVLLVCLATLLALPGRGHAKEAQDTKGTTPGVRWDVGRSDIVQYDRYTVTVRKDKEHRGSKKLCTIQGWDLRGPRGRGRGQYAPASPEFGDLPQVLAFHLTRPGEEHSKVKLEWKPREVVGLRIKGDVRITRRVPGETHLEGQFDFKSRGKPTQRDRWSLDKGKAITRLVWNDAQGIVQKSEIELQYERRNLNVRGRAARRDIERRYVYELKGLRRMGAKDSPTFVKSAIERGVKHLRTLQEEDGSFKPFKEYKIGTTALAVLALVASGVPADDKQIRKALSWMFDQDPDKTYDRAAALMAIDRVYTPENELLAIQRGNIVTHPKRDLPPERRAWVMREAAELMASAPSPGAWGYPSGGNLRMSFDLSNTQYAVLGMRAAYHLGYFPVDGMGRKDEDAWEDMWIGVIRTCRSLQARKGPKGKISLIQHGQAIPDESQAHRLYEKSVPKVAGFRYSTVEGESHISGSMTCAGISCLLVARHQLLLIDCSRLNDKMAKEIDDLLNGGWAWLEKHWSMDRHPRHPAGRWYYYYLYCLERAGILGNIKRIGGKDWHFEGAEQLIARQLENGSWNHQAMAAMGGGTGQWTDARRNDVPPTCFALLFLQRGTAPLQGEITCK